MSAHDSATAIFPSSKSSGGKRVTEPGGFHANFASQNSDFRMPQMKGVQQMRTAPGSANKDPTKVPFLCHQSREFQPGFVTGFFLLLFNKTRGKTNLYSKIFSWQQECIRVQQPCKRSSPLSHYYTCRKEIKLNQGIKTAERDDCSPETLISHLQTAFAKLLPRTFPIISLSTPLNTII